MSGCRAMVSTTKKCQRCGASFSCGLGCCWCGEVPLDERARAAIAERFDDCLCPSCLDHFRATAKQQVAEEA